VGWLWFGVFLIGQAKYQGIDDSPWLFCFPTPPKLTPNSFDSLIEHHRRWLETHQNEAERPKKDSVHGTQN
jgi:hypothetical protein